MCTRIHRILAEIQGALFRRRARRDPQLAVATAVMSIDMHAKLWMN